MCKRNIFQAYFPLIASYLLILLFMYAATSKLLDYEKFKAQIGQSPLLTSFSGSIAVTIPALEIVISIMLAVPSLRLIALYSSFSLMTMFSAYIFIILNNSEYIPCSCGGILQNMGWSKHLIFNTVFVLITLVGILSHNINYFIAIKPGHTENL